MKNKNNSIEGKHIKERNIDDTFIVNLIKLLDYIIIDETFIINLI